MSSRRTRGILLGTALAVLAAAATGVAGGAAAAPARPAMVTVLVTMDHQADLGEVTGGTRRARLQSLVTTLQSTAADGQRAVTDLLDTLAATGSVARVEPLWIVDALSVTATPAVVAALAERPDVAAVVPDAIHLEPATTVEPNVTTTNAPAVWDHGDTGAGVVVATLDSGADVTHPDLESSWRGGANSWYDPYGQHTGGPVDLNGHGTAVLGAMVGGAASGSAIGIAPGARWIAARVFDDRGASSTTAVHRAFQWLLDPDGNPATADAPQVVNGSWSLGAGPGCDLGFQPDVAALSAAGILPVFAAGNYGSGAGTDTSPANYPESLAVGALADADTVLASSSRGPSTCGGRTGTFPDVSAPGRDILTTDRYGLYQLASGTSIAAPQVAGVLALLLAAHPGLTPAQQRDALTLGATDLGAPGPDPDTGYGRVDALASYDRVMATPAPDFSVIAQPMAASVVAGSTATFSVTVAPTSGSPGDATVSVTAPPGTTAAVAPATLPGSSGTSTVTITTSASTTPGTYPVPVDVVAGAVHHAVTPSRAGAAAPTVRLELSTLGNAAPAGLAGTPDDADVLSWDGTTFRRVVDASAAPWALPAGANLDGFSRLDASRFYVSFSGDVKLPGLGTVQDEDVLLFDGTRWTTWFDGTAHGLTSAALDIDAMSVVDGTLYFSTYGVAKVPGVPGSADDADVYRWDGSAFDRVWDASAVGLPGAANVDGLDVTDPTHLAVSFSTTSVNVPGVGTTQDEDVVRYDGGAWSTWFDGTAAGLTTDALDVDAFDIP